MAKGRSGAKSSVRFSMRWKIILPYLFLALSLGVGAVVLVTRILSLSAQTRFVNQLVDSGQQATDAVVRVEMDLLEVLRLIANTEGVAAATAAGDSEVLRSITLPLVFNANLDYATILGVEEVSLLAIRKGPESSIGEYETLKGETFYADWDALAQSLSATSDDIGDKFVGLERVMLGVEEKTLFFVAGPVRDTSGKTVGAVLVGTYLDTLVDSLFTQAGANISIYALDDGRLLDSTLEPGDPLQLALAQSDLSLVLADKGEKSHTRQFDVANTPYQEVLTSLIARQGTEQLAVIGISLRDAGLQNIASEYVFQVARYGAVALVFVLAVGLLISNAITRPLVEVARATEQLAAGNLDTIVASRSSDEVGLVARNFNAIVQGLRDRTPLAESLGALSTRELRLAISRDDETIQGKSTTATVLVADLTSLTAQSEGDAKSILTTLQHFLGAALPIMSDHGGVIEKFDGQNLIAHFGILPHTLPASESALKGLHAAFSLLDAVDEWNEERSARGFPALDVWIGLATGPVIAGAIGPKDYLQFTVVGDTVVLARGVQEVCREVGEGAVLITEEMYKYLGDAQRQFKFGRFGEAQMNRAGRQVVVYEVIERRIKLSERGSGEGIPWTDALVNSE